MFLSEYHPENLVAGMNYYLLSLFLIVKDRPTKNDLLTKIKTKFKNLTDVE